MRAEIIAVGTELLLGEIVNTNANFLALSLKDLGIDHHYQTVVGDNAERLSQVILAAISRADLIVLTGGIGPTPDDLTHETLAKTFALELVEFPEVLVSMRNIFESRGKTMSSSNLKQAKLPFGSKLLANPIGTAWGVWLEPELGKIVLTMPGVPTEMKKMWADQVIPKLVEKGISRHKVNSRNYRIFGLPESKIAEMLGHHLDSDQPSVATYAETFGVRIRTASRSEPALSDEILDKFEKVVISPLFADFVYSTDGSALESVVGSMLQRRGESVAVAESCTGGLLSKLFTDVPGSSQWVVGSVTAYSNFVKNQILGVRDGTLSAWGSVSMQVCFEMADGVRRALKSDWSISTTGFAGPAVEGKNEDVGLVYIGILGPDGFVHISEHRFGAWQRRDMIRIQASVSALNLLRLAMGRSPSLPPSLLL